MMTNRAVAIHINVLDKLRHDVFAVGFQWSLWSELEAFDAAGSSYAKELIEFLNLLSYNPLQIQNASKLLLHKTQGANVEIDTINLSVLKGRLESSSTFSDRAQYGSASYAAVLCEYRYVRGLVDQLSNAFNFRDLFLIEQDNKKNNAYKKRSGKKSRAEDCHGTSSIEGGGKLASDQNLYYFQLCKGNQGYAQLFEVLKQYRSDLIDYAAQYHWRFRIVSIFGDRILMSANAQQRTGLCALLGGLFISDYNAESNPISSQSLGLESPYITRLDDEVEDFSGDESCICHWTDGWRSNAFQA